MHFMTTPRKVGDVSLTAAALAASLAVKCMVPSTHSYKRETAHISPI